MAGPLRTATLERRALHGRCDHHCVTGDPVGRVLMRFSFKALAVGFAALALGAAVEAAHNPAQAQFYRGYGYHGGYGPVGPRPVYGYGPAYRGGPFGARPY